MYILGYILIVLGRISHTILQMYMFVVFISVILSWIRPAPDNEVIRTILSVIHKITEPVFFQVRKRLPSFFFSAGLDFTPVIVLLGIYFADMLFSGLLMEIGFQLRMDAMSTSTLDTFQNFK